ncbi:MAG: hypothetical protein GY821_02815 [Gammaproteobacteria bacterium]|nr:hypothetical protein [Gammaproteobacteria bacterium]
MGKDTNLTEKKNPCKPFSSKFPTGTFSHVASDTTYEVCEVGATNSDQCHVSVDGITVTANSDGSLLVAGNAPASVGTAIHSIIAVNEFGASQPSPNSGARLTLVTQNAPSAKDYSTTAGFASGRHFNFPLPKGVFSNVDATTQYELCDWKPDGSMGPCQHNYGDYYAAANPDGSVQFHGTGIEGTGIFYDFSVIAITPFGSSVPSKNHGVHVKIAGAA